MITTTQTTVDDRLENIVKHYRNYILDVSASPTPVADAHPDRALLRDLAVWYDDAPRRMQVDYRPFKDQLAKQFRMAVSFGYTAELMDENPFDAAREMSEHVRETFHLPTLSSDTGDFPGNHPLLSETTFRDVNGTPMRWNDIFRFVHDLFGHVHLGHEIAPFDLVGEFRAWLMHRQMFTTAAEGVLAAETIAQIAWMAEAPRFDGDDRPVEDREFPESKAVEVPSHMYDALSRY